MEPNPPISKEAVLILAQARVLRKFMEGTRFKFSGSPFSSFIMPNNREDMDILGCLLGRHFGAKYMDPEPAVTLLEHKNSVFLADQKVMGKLLNLRLISHGDYVTYIHRHDPFRNYIDCRLPVFGDKIQIGLVREYENKINGLEPYEEIREHDIENEETGDLYFVKKIDFRCFNCDHNYYEDFDNDEKLPEELTCDCGQQYEVREDRIFVKAQS